MHVTGLLNSSKSPEFIKEGAVDAGFASVFPSVLCGDGSILE